MSGIPAAPSLPAPRQVASGGREDFKTLSPALLPGLSPETRSQILSIVSRENAARKLLIPGTEPLKASAPEITTTIRFNEAGLALLAASTQTGQLKRAARRRYKALVADSIQKLLGWRSIRQVAREVGMDAMEISRALRGEKDIQVKTAVRLAAALHIPVGELIAHIEAARKQPLIPVRPHSSRRP